MLTFRSCTSCDPLLSFESSLSGLEAPIVEQSAMPVAPALSLMGDRSRSAKLLSLSRPCIPRSLSWPFLIYCLSKVAEVVVFFAWATSVVGAAALSP